MPAFCSGWRDSNPCRPSVPLFGTFRPFRLDLRQQACTSKNENCSKIVYCRVQSSFAWADFCSGKAKPAANTWRICKGFNAAWAKISRSKPTRVQVPSAYRHGVFSGGYGFYVLYIIKHQSGFVTATHPRQSAVSPTHCTEIIVFRVKVLIYRFRCCKILS